LYISDYLKRLPEEAADRDDAQGDLSMKFCMTGQEKCEFLRQVTA
jgi:hypothetical protein